MGNVVFSQQEDKQNFGAAPVYMSIFSFYWTKWEENVHVVEDYFQRWRNSHLVQEWVFVAAGHGFSGLTCFLVLVGAETSARCFSKSHTAAARLQATGCLHPKLFEPISIDVTPACVWTWKMDSSWVWEIAASATSGNEVLQSKLFPACVLQARVEILLICSDVSLSLALISHCSVCGYILNNCFCSTPLKNLCKNISPSLLFLQIINVVISNQSWSMIQYQTFNGCRVPRGTF